MKYNLSYTFNEGIEGGILGTTGIDSIEKKDIIFRIMKFVLLKEWSKYLKEITITIKACPENRGKPKMSKKVDK